MRLKTIGQTRLGFPCGGIRLHSRADLGTFMLNPIRLVQTERSKDQHSYRTGTQIKSARAPNAFLVLTNPAASQSVKQIHVRKQTVPKPQHANQPQSGSSWLSCSLYASFASSRVSILLRQRGDPHRLFSVEPEPAACAANSLRSVKAAGWRTTETRLPAN